MEISAESLTIKKVLTKGKFIIPEFQREYDWDKENIQELLDAILNNDSEENYFIGHMVFEGKKDGDIFNVIDGQQRITTITLLLCTIRDRFLELKKDDYANLLHNKYIITTDDNNNKFAVLQNDMPYPTLQARILELPTDRKMGVTPQKKGEKKIIEGYDYIKERLKLLNEDDLVKLRDKVLNLETIFVLAEGLSNSFTIFRTLNTTGKDLSSLDLAKNLIFSLYPKGILKEPTETWKKILQNINTNENFSDKFFNNFYSSRYKKVSENTVYKEFEKNINKDSNKAKTMLEEMLIDSIIYKKITWVQQSDWGNNDYDIFFSLHAIIRTFKIEVANSLLMTLIRGFESKSISKSKLMEVLRAIEQFHFINNAICSNRSSGLDMLYSKHSVLIHNAPNKQGKHSQIDVLIRKITEKKQSLSKDLYDNKFNERVYYTRYDEKQKPLVKYVLLKLESIVNPNSILKDISIEHIYPENPDDNWAPLKEKELFRSIGNLVLLDSGLNSRIGNEDYTNKKKEIMKESHIVTTKNVFESNDSWNDESINCRTNEIKDNLYKL